MELYLTHLPERSSMTSSLRKLQFIDKAHEKGHTIAIRILMYISFEHRRGTLTVKYFYSFCDISNTILCVNYSQIDNNTHV